MSRYSALIKFAKTGNVYWGCFNGPSDSMYRDIVPFEQLTGKYSFDLFDRLAKKSKDSQVTPDDIDDIAIYRGGDHEFNWYGKGSESQRCIVEGLTPFAKPDSYSDGKPAWVTEFLNNRCSK